METTTFKQLKQYIKLNLEKILIENDLKAKYEYDEYLYCINNIKEYHILECLSFYHLRLIDVDIMIKYKDFNKFTEK